LHPEKNTFFEILLIELAARVCRLGKVNSVIGQECWRLTISTLVPISGIHSNVHFGIGIDFNIVIDIDFGIDFEHM
jgi:hypothetical protein